MDRGGIERRRHPAPARGIAAALILILILIFIFACIRFALVQDIWIDESTQLSGISLSPSALVVWLAGSDTGRFGVPGDRMPPLGYLVDWAWWHGVSQSVFAFRLFHAALVAAALWLFARTERAFAGGPWPWVGLALLILSPKVIQFAVELRAYPMLFALACVQAAVFLRLVAGAGRPKASALAGFALLSIATCFTHFFGLVAACAYFGALLLRFLRTALLRIILAGLATLAPAVALKPFVVGANTVSEAYVIGTSPLQYIAQLFGGSAYLVLPIAGLLFLAGCVLLFALGICGAIGRAMARRMEPVDYLVVVMALGTLAPIAAHFVLHGFDPLKPSYSIWLLPVLALIVASGARDVAAPAIWWRRGVQGAVLAMLLGAAVSTAIFLLHADWYAHGPARAIATAREAAPADTPIVYVGADRYGYGYFPTVYLSHGQAAQWLVEQGGVRRLPDGPVEPLATLDRYRLLLLVDIRPRRFSDLGACLKGACPAFDPAPELSALQAAGRWHETATGRSFGYYDTTIARWSAAR